ncbi:hypothetical protein [Psychrobacter sp.]|uniref:hypothetical protein n=1 Tax=Psychrobacter sp. TaxID=56811 RepID=UPI0025F3FB89|nr:hypothetical protein [Psychrobacter sp.]
MPAQNNTAKEPDNTKAPRKGALFGSGLNWFEKKTNIRLIAIIKPVIEQDDKAGQGQQVYIADPEADGIAAVFEDAEFTLEAQYSTPFENSNPEGRMPNAMGMIQSGQLPATMYSLFGLDSESADPNSIQGVAGQAAEALEGLKNRSNFTKINSRQIYTSSSSVRITGTLVFQAWANAHTEVEAALRLLQQYVLPKKLSDTSLVVNVADSGAEGLFPSIIPPLVQLQYGGYIYKPLFIESLSAPMTAPMTKNGDRIAVRAQVTLLSLTAWDQSDLLKLKTPKKA